MKKKLTSVVTILLLTLVCCFALNTDNVSAAQQGYLAMDNTGTWYYYVGDAVDWNYTGMASNENGWFYVSNGKLDWNYTGMACNEYGWWYMTNGVIDFNYTGMALNDYGWWYITNGALDLGYTGMALNDYGWWYIKNGALDLSYTGMADNDYGTWYMINGALAVNFTGVVNNVNVVNGLAVGHNHNWIHHDAVYGEKFIPKEDMTRNIDGGYVIDEGYEQVTEDHLICGTCRKDFGIADDEAVEAWAEHAMSGDFYTSCQNYFIDFVLVGEKCNTMITPAYDECSECGEIR